MSIEDLYFLSKDEGDSIDDEHHKCKICTKNFDKIVCINYYPMITYSQFYCLDHIFEPLKLKIQALHTASNLYNLPLDIKSVIYNFMFCEESIDFNNYHYLIKYSDKYPTYKSYQNRYVRWINDEIQSV